MPRLLHPNAAHVADILISRGHHGVVVTSPDPWPTAEAAAESIGVEVGALVKSSVFLLDDDPVLILVSAKHRVNAEATGKRLDGALTPAPLDLVELATGQPVGGIAPVGHPTNLTTYVDESLANYPELWAAAGYPGTAFRTTCPELLRITAGLAVDVT
ncbi:YbaK/EbsC family protein [Rhodococcus sp. G-MC3]|uniref:YbaK/EbsC family protein n=1 Tax=Rhodococcus sp. G-MC3 TaxID=3046209 RepID=UPI0024B951DE|nr:YbaK/EbsC family protein [Rhodococcus sp. G-MC3]MDJ0393453.1 YbaK/EbsC family protein [Rhodococcus sp. G-MC3]